jgi:site-specific DNA recombinase
MEKKKVMAGYCRVSTLEQKKKGYGIQIQKREIENLAESLGVVVDVYYIDEAKSGFSENRRSLKRLIRDCRTGKIKGIIVASLDRLSRNLRLTENLLFDFDRLGIRIYIADMPSYDGNDRKDILLRQIREAIAEENRKEIIKRLKKGREERVRKGRMPGGTLPYGYARADRNITRNPLEVEIVRLIFSERTQKNYQDIAEFLNQQSLRRRNGSPWTQRSVSAIVSREPLYKNGVIKYGQTLGKNEDLVIL